MSMRDNTSQTMQVTPVVEIPLAKAMSIATRSQHARLNQLILSRLPLALPPHSESPEPYANGLLHFAAIYYAFESAWQILSDYEPADELPLDTAVVLSSLIHLHIPALPRSERLKDDLSLLLDIPQSEIAFRMRHPALKQTADFVMHIQETARNKPHALIAYSWVLYMALFNGGRWIREQLATARDISWVENHNELESAVSTNHTAGLTFWYFDSAEDGDDIKNEFKARLEDVGSMLNADQKEDIVDEAKTIFERCAAIVEELHTQAQPKPQVTAQDESTKWSKTQDFLALFLPVILMQLLMILVKRLSGARIRAPLPFRKLDRKDD